MHRKTRAVAVCLVTIAACRSGNRDSDPVAASQQQVAVETPSPAVDPASAEDSLAATFRAAGACDDCRVLRSSALVLAETGVTGRSAKLMRRDGSVFSVTLSSSGSPLDEKKILDDERAARSKYGKFEPRLQKWLASAADADEAWVWIRVPFTIEVADRVGLDPTRKKKLEARVSDEISRATKPVREWLASTAGNPMRADEGGPILRAKLKAKLIRALEKVPSVAEIGTDGFPGRANGDAGGLSAWNDTLGLPIAHRLSRGALQAVCVKEQTKPDDSTNLNVVLPFANPSGTPDLHTRLAAGLISNNTTTAFSSVAPDASLYIANFGGFTGTGGINDWCRQRQASTLSYSWSVDALGAGTASGIDAAHDWLAVHTPWMLVVASAGTINPTTPAADTVANKGYNGLVVGGVDDKITADITDDTVATNVGWRNPATSWWTDYELPHVVAPSNGTTVVGGSINGPSAATAMVAGVSALLGAGYGTLNSWPETKRAIIIATATGRAGAPAMTFAGGSVDRKVGAGEVDAAAAVSLGIGRWDVSAGNVSSESGHVGRTIYHSAGFDSVGIYHASDFGSDGYLTRKWKTKATRNGRLRVVMTWDAMTFSCTDPTNCSSVTLDTDLDLYLWKKSPGDTSWTPTGPVFYYSSSYRGSWEMVDVPVSKDEEYLIAPYRYSWQSSASGTYLGLAWYQYQLPAGTACSTNLECASQSCSGGLCTCVDSTWCRDGKTCSLGACKTCGGVGQPCCDGTTAPGCAPKASCSAGTCVSCPGCNPALTVLPAKSSFTLSEPVVLRAYLPNASTTACGLSDDPRGVLTIESLTRDGTTFVVPSSLSQSRLGSGFAGYVSGHVVSTPAVTWRELPWRSEALSPTASLQALPSTTSSASDNGVTAKFSVGTPGTYQATVRYVPPDFLPTASLPRCAVSSQTATVSFTVVGG